MKISNNKCILVLIFLSLFLVEACSTDNAGVVSQDPDELYEDGFFVVNEGKFPEAGSITFINRALHDAEQHIFQKNNQEDVGSTPQSMFFDHQDRAYIIANGSNFITVVDRYTFDKIARIDQEGAFDVPRYGLTFNNKAYITNSPFNEDPFLTIIDLKDFTVDQKINLNGAAEFIFKADNNLIYIQEAAFDQGHQIAVLDPATDEIKTTIQTEKKLNSMIISDRVLYALSPHKLQKFDLDDQSEMAAIPLNYEENPANLTADQGNLYYTVGNQVYKMNQQAAAAPKSSIFAAKLGFLYGFTVHNSRIFMADGGDFASDSSIQVYNLKGELLKKIGVGIGPNGFYFN